MIRTEKDIVTPLKPIFYKRFVDDIYNRRKKGIHDNLYERLNNYHPNNKLTIEINPNKFLDTKTTDNEGTIETKVYRKTTKLPVSWASNIPKRYNRNIINTDLNRAKRITSNLDNEQVIIKKKFLAADYPHKFVNSVINTFIEKEIKKNEEYLIPQNFFEIPKPVTLIELPFCVKNQTASKQFIKKFNYFTNYKLDVRIKWLTRKIRTLFQLKDKSLHPACKIYEGICICGEKYIGETKRNVEIRWMEHNTPSVKSNPVKHLSDNIDHSFTWKAICNAPNRKTVRKILEAYFIATMKPSLNDQIDSDLLELFRNGIT